MGIDKKIHHFAGQVYAVNMSWSQAWVCHGSIILKSAGVTGKTKLAPTRTHTQWADMLYCYAGSNPQIFLLRPDIISTVSSILEVLISLSYGAWWEGCVATVTAVHVHQRCTHASFSGHPGSHVPWFISMAAITCHLVHDVNHEDYVPSVWASADTKVARDGLCSPKYGSAW